MAWGDVLDRNSRPFLSLSAFLFSGCLACQGVYKPLAAAAAAKRLGSQTVTAPPTQAGRLLLSLRLYIRTDKQTDKQTNRQASSAVTCRSPFRVRPDFFSTFFFFFLPFERKRAGAIVACFLFFSPSLSVFAAAAPWKEAKRNGCHPIQMLKSKSSALPPSLPLSFFSPPLGRSRESECMERKKRRKRRRRRRKKKKKGCQSPPLHLALLLGSPPASSPSLWPEVPELAFFLLVCARVFACLLFRSVGSVVSPPEEWDSAWIDR